MILDKHFHRRPIWIAAGRIGRANHPSHDKLWRNQVRSHVGGTSTGNRLSCPSDQVFRVHGPIPQCSCSDPAARTRPLPIHMRQPVRLYCPTQYLDAPKTNVFAHPGKGLHSYAQKPLFEFCAPWHYAQGFCAGVIPPRDRSGGLAMQTYFYSRVSTADQTTANQSVEAEKVGARIDHAYSETISGKVPAADRPVFGEMLKAIERTNGDKRLIVSRLDRLGRDAADVLATVKRLGALGCTVKVLQLGDIDLTGGPGKVVLATLAAVGEIERDLIVERTKAGLDRARKEGKRLGRPLATDPSMQSEILAALEQGDSVAATARRFGVSRRTVERVRGTAA